MSVIFYHVSTTKIEAGETLKRLKKPAEWRVSQGFNQNFACLAYDLEHARFWIRAFEYGKYPDDPTRFNDVWHIHKIHVPENEVVELCLDGIYYNFGEGIRGTAGEIKSLGVVELDSEIIITTDNAKVVSASEFNSNTFKN